MLTERFYAHLALRLKSEAESSGRLFVAVGRGTREWDSFPPALQRDVLELQAEAARVEVAAEDVIFLDRDGNEARDPGPMLRVTGRFRAGALTGTLRECGLFCEEEGRSVLLGYFIHPRIDIAASDALDRHINLDLRPGRSRVEEHITRYLGNSRDEEVHDLENENRNCQIGEIRIDRRHYFPSIDAARALGYDFCAFCFGRRLSER